MTSATMAHVPRRFVTEGFQAASRRSPARVLRHCGLGIVGWQGPRNEAKVKMERTFRMADACQKLRFLYLQLTSAGEHRFYQSCHKYVPDGTVIRFYGNRLMVVIAAISPLDE